MKFLFRESGTFGSTAKYATNGNASPTSLYSLFLLEDLIGFQGRCSDVGVGLVVFIPDSLALFPLEGSLEPLLFPRWFWFLTDKFPRRIVLRVLESPEFLLAVVSVSLFVSLNRCSRTEIHVTFRTLDFIVRIARRFAYSRSSHVFISGLHRAEVSPLMKWLKFTRARVLLGGHDCGRTIRTGIDGGPKTALTSSSALCATRFQRLMPWAEPAKRPG